ncbi:MAG: cell division protein FtsQ/DivIB [Clostridia bacterium]
MRSGSKTRQNSKKKKKIIEKTEPKTEKFNFDQEIVIGVTRIPEQEKQKKKTNTLSKKSKKNGKNKVKKSSQMPKSEKQIVAMAKRKKKIHKIIGYTTLIILLLVSIVAIMLSPLFDIQEITVEGNEKISSSEIITLSGIMTAENTFKISSKKIKEQIKENAYIEKVEIKRQLPSGIKIIVTERKPSFMLEYENRYIYLNTQGYLLEISSEPLEVPIIQGTHTELEDLQVGNRLCVEDLEKMTTVLKIMETAQNNGIGNFITRIGIEDSQDYKIVLGSKQKTAYLGDSSNLSTKMLNVKAILEKEEGVPGEIFVNMDLNKGYPMFRQTV